MSCLVLYRCLIRYDNICCDIMSRYKFKEGPKYTVIVHSGSGEGEGNSGAIGR